MLDGAPRRCSAAAPAPRHVCATRKPRRCVHRIGRVLLNPKPEPNPAGIAFTRYAGDAPPLSSPPAAPRRHQRRPLRPDSRWSSRSNPTAQIPSSPSQTSHIPVNSVLFANKPLDFIKINPPSYAVEKYLQTSPLSFVLDPDLLGNRTRRPGSVVLLSNPRELGLILF